MLLDCITEGATRFGVEKGGETSFGDYWSFLWFFLSYSRPFVSTEGPDPDSLIRTPYRDSRLRLPSLFADFALFGG